MTTQPRKQPSDRRPATRKSALKARLLKVQVQPLLVMDDGKSLIEVAGDPLIIAAGDWPEFAAKSFGPEVLAAYADAYKAQTEAGQ